MSLISLHAPLPLSIRQAAKAAFLRVPRRLQLVAGAMLLLLASWQVTQALQTPAQSIRSALTAAGDEAAALPWNRSPEQVQRAIGRHFAGHEFRVQPAGFPADVAVVLTDVDRGTCLEARQLARRIEGDVVITLDGYGSANDCRTSNAMTWHLLP